MQNKQNKWFINLTNQATINRLLITIYRGKDSEIKTILSTLVHEHGNSILNKKDGIGHTPIIKAVIRKKLWLVKKLIGLSVDVNIPTNYKGLTPLHIACFNGYYKIVKYLIDVGKADINALSKRKWSPLHSSCSKNQYLVAKLLVDKGCILRVLNNNRKYPWDLCSDKNIIKLIKTKIKDISKRVKIKKKEINFKLISKIGDGAFASVFKALTDTQEVIAVKRILVRDDSSSIKQIEKEINFYNKLKHENIVRYLGFQRKKIEFDDYMFILLEYCSEGTLKTFFKKIKSIEKRIECLKIYLKQVINGLVFLHSNEIVHRDIKPSNILMKLENNKICAKLADFGCMKENASQLMTMIVGTSNFIAPELIKDSNHNQKITYYPCDIWSLGITILDLLVDNYCLWEDHQKFEDQLALLIHISNLEDSPKIPSCIKDKNLRNLISKCITIDPKNRSKAKELLVHPFFSSDNIDYSDKTNYIIEEFESFSENHDDDFDSIKTYKTQEKPKTK